MYGNWLAGSTTARAGLSRRYSEPVCVHQNKTEPRLCRPFFYHCLSMEGHASFSSKPWSHVVRSLIDDSAMHPRSRHAPPSLEHVHTPACPPPCQLWSSMDVDFILLSRPYCVCFCSSPEHGASDVGANEVIELFTSRADTLLSPDRYNLIERISSSSSI